MGIAPGIPLRPDLDVTSGLPPEGMQQPLQPFEGRAPEETARMRLRADSVVSRYRRGQSKKRFRDLSAEKNMVVADAEGELAWAEVVKGSVVLVPPKAGNSIRWTRNLLRPMLSNFISYFTSIPMRVVAESPPGRKTRDKARVDTLLGNHIVGTQNLNALMAEAMMVAGTYGYCPIHITWRDGWSGEKPYDPLYEPEDMQEAQGAPGAVPETDEEVGHPDIWLGDPWATVWDDAATRRRVHWCIYERTVRLDLVKSVFGDIPEAATLTGSDRLPSTSRYQRIVRHWESIRNNSTSTTAALQSASSGGDQGEELISVLCEEVAPGVDPEWPEGRMTIVAVSGEATLDSYASGSGGGDATYLYEGPLPAGRMSIVRVYSLSRWDDVLGKAYLNDLVPLQQQLNQVVTMRGERLARYSFPQLMAQAGTIEEDTSVADPNSIMFVSGPTYPTFLAPPQGNPDYSALQQEIESQMFRIGGWQAASRGESNAGDPAAKVIALSKADDTIFGPVARDFEDALIEILQTAHALYRENANGAVLAKIGGEDFQYAVQPWIRSKDLSPEPPNYKMTSGFGATPESMAVTLQNMVGMMSADGQPLMTAEEFWDRYPDPSMKPNRPSPVTVRRRRLNAVNAYMEEICAQAEQEYMQQIQQDPKIFYDLAEALNKQVYDRFPIVRTDDAPMCLESLDELVLDTTSSPLCRTVAEMRQAMYFQWQAQQMAQAMGGPAAEAPVPQDTGEQGTPEKISQFTPPEQISAGEARPASINPNEVMGEVRANTDAAANAGVIQ